MQAWRSWAFLSKLLLKEEQQKEMEGKGKKSREREREWKKKRERGISKDLYPLIYTVAFPRPFPQFSKISSGPEI